MKKKLTYYIAPVLLAVIIFGSNFLNTSIFATESLNFSVWFVMSVFTFAAGWFIDKVLGWRDGGLMVFIVTVATAIVSLIFVSLFSHYFNINDATTEALVLYSLRNIFLGSMAFFGMAIPEVFSLQKIVSTAKRQSDEHEKLLEQAEKIAEQKIKEAALKADELLLDAKKKSVDIIENKSRIQNQLKEFILAEKELIKKYEKENID